MTYTEDNEEMNQMKLLILIFFFHTTNVRTVCRATTWKEGNHLFFRVHACKISSVDAEGVNHGCTQCTFRI